MGFNTLENRPIVWVEPCNRCRGKVLAAFDRLAGEFQVLPALAWLNSSDELIAWLTAAESDEHTVPLLIVLRGSVGPICPIQLLGNLKSSPWRFIPVIMVIDRVIAPLIDQLWDSGADLVLVWPAAVLGLAADLRAILRFYECGELPSIGRLHGLSGPKRIRQIEKSTDIAD